MGLASCPLTHSSASRAASGPAVSGYRSSWKRSDWAGGGGGLDQLGAQWQDPLVWTLGSHLLTVLGLQAGTLSTHPPMAWPQVASLKHQFLISLPFRIRPVTQEPSQRS